jgi:hypothetical protein
MWVGSTADAPHQAANCICSQLCTALPQGYLQNCLGLRMPDPDVLLDKEKTMTSFNTAILWKITHTKHKQRIKDYP